MRRTTALFLFTLVSCATNGKKDVEHAAADQAVWASPDTLQNACKDGLAAIEKIRGQVKAEKTHTVASTLEPYNDMLLEIDRTEGMMSLMANVHPEKEVRTAAEACEQDLEKLVNAINLDRALYEAVSAVDVSGADEETQRFVKKLLEDFRRSGVDKDEATRAELKALHAKMVEVGQAFGRAIREDVRSIEVDPKALEGLPQDFIDAHPPNENGKVVLTTNYPDFFPVEQYAKDEAVRKALYVEFQKRGHPENDENLKKLLALRKQYAAKLGYPSWAEYMAEDKMVKSASAIEKFVEEITAIGRPRMERDLETLKARKAKDSPDNPTVQVWDRFYYTELVRREKYGFDAQTVRPYFEFGRVTAGLMDLYGELFGIRFEKDEEAERWARSVLAYRMYTGDELIGRFYLDMHPRDGKYGHAAMFGIQTGVSGGQIPVASLVCNFPGGDDEGPGLMDHTQVVTYFHEFGHLVHHLLARGSKWANLAGINTEWDFVEAPSQLLEEWAWDPAVLARFAKHHETNEPIPAELVKKMKASSEFGKGIHIMRQVYYTALSYYLHTADPEGLDLLPFVQEIQTKYSPYPYVDGTYGYASFGHLNGYSSMYYTYQWSLTLAKDIFTRFEENGLLDEETARAYRKMVLMPGGTKPAGTLVKDFLGRPHNLDAYKRWLQEE